MGCGCNKSTSSGKWELVGTFTAQDGIYSSEIEARAAQVRAGGGGIIKAK